MHLIVFFNRHIEAANSSYPNDMSAFSGHKQRMTTHIVMAVREVVIHREIAASYSFIRINDVSPIRRLPESQP